MKHPRLLSLFIASIAIFPALPGLSVFPGFPVLSAFPAQSVSLVEVKELRCEMLHNPQGISAVHPRFAWRIVSDERNVN